jgi:hypothetical protein
VQVLSNFECKTWFLSHNIEVESDERLILPSQGYGREFITPPASRIQLVLSHSLAEWFDCSHALFWMSTWPHFEEEELQLFHKWRQRHGNKPRLIDAPGHLFEHSSSVDVWTRAELMLFVIAFNWEGYFLHPQQQSIIWIGDDIIEVITQEKTKDQELEQLLDTLNIPHEVTMTL